MTSCKSPEIMPTCRGIKGTRTVYDTVTGATGTADSNYVNGVVDRLNEAWRSIPIDSCRFR